MRKIKVKDVLDLLNNNERVLGNQENYFTNAPTADNVTTESLDWINPLKENKLDYLLNSKAKVIICDESVDIPQKILNERCVIITESPKLTFLRIVNHYFTSKTEFGIHSTTTIHPEAKISEKCYIGPYTYIGKCNIGDNTIIHGHCYVYDNVDVGAYVTIHAGAVIGADGFGYQRNEKGEFEKFPHIGGVVIKNNVEIGSNTCIDRGALGNTIICEGAKIDNLVHIAHNVVVGKHSAVIANSMIGGSTKIGNYSWIAPSTSLRDQITIGNKITVGMGAVVTKSIPDNETWAGSPAKPLDEFIELQKKFKKL